jgi:uncharacterized membrane protein YbaN (DUF454 family)
MESPDSPDPPPALSPVVRAALLACGTLFLAIGLVGLVLPVLPTTPFVLLAAACFARGSRSAYEWLLANRTLGPMIREWRQYRSIAYRTKIAAIVLMSATLAASIVFYVRPWWLQAALALFGVGMAVWLYRIPSRDRP